MITARTYWTGKKSLTFVLLCGLFLSSFSRSDNTPLPIYSPPGSASSSESNQEEGSCGCEEEDFPPGAGFAFRREGYAVVNIEGGKVARQRHFFENERVTFKEVLTSGDGKTFPQVGQRALLRYTEFTSNECLPESKDESAGGLRIDDMNHSIVNAIEGLDELLLKMSLGEKAMYFASLDLGCVRALQAWLQWWLEATCSEMMDAGARIYEVQLLRLEGAPTQRTSSPSGSRSTFLW